MTPTHTRRCAMTTWLADAARARRRRGLTRTTSPVLAGAVDLASNDYLGLARDPQVGAAAVEAIRRHGTGARASRVVSGTTAVHDEVEAELAALTGQPAALVLSSGYAANLAAVTALGGPGTLLVLDAHAHASLHDAARLARSRVVVTTHGDVAAVATALAERREPRALVAVESVYSVLGDTADLPTLAAVCAETDAVLLVDEAHGVGVLGDGRGGVHAAGLAGAGHVFVTATLSKALGAQGGAVLGTPALREHLVSSARPFVYDTGLAPAAAAAAAQACRIVASRPALVAQMHRRAALLARLTGVGRAAGAVQSVPVGDATVALAAAEELRGRGILVGCFRPPSVPDGVSRLRLTADAGLPVETIERAGRAVAQVVERLTRGEPRPGS